MSGENQQDRTFSELSGETSDESVRRKTGKGWQEWFQILDDAGAAEMTHPQIARFLDQQYNVPGWWCQQITGVYERARGLRSRHEMPDGYQIGKSRTFSVPISRIFQAWADETQRSEWLDPSEMQVRKINPEKSIRFGWEKGKSTVEVSFTPKGDAKSQVTIAHSKLPDSGEAEKMKSYWIQVLDRLQNYLQTR